MMLDHYQQTKNLLVSYDINPLGFFCRTGPRDRSFPERSRRLVKRAAGLTAARLPPPRQEADYRAAGIAIACVHHVQHTTGKTGVDNNKIEVKTHVPRTNRPCARNFRGRLRKRRRHYFNTVN